MPRVAGARTGTRPRAALRPRGAAEHAQLKFGAGLIARHTSIASAARSKAYASTPSADSRPGTAPNKLWLTPLDSKDHWSDRLTRVPTKASLLRHEFFVEEAKQKFAQNFFTKNAAV